MKETNALIVGLGNPGGSYEDTRHNIGFIVLDAIAKEENWKFKSDMRLKCRFVSGVLEENRVRL